MSKTLFLIAKLHILMINNVIFTFYDQRFGDRKRCFGNWKRFQYLNRCVRDRRLSGVVMTTYVITLQPGMSRELKRTVSLRRFF